MKAIIENEVNNLHGCTQKVSTLNNMISLSVLQMIKQIRKDTQSVPNVTRIFLIHFRRYIKLS